MRGGLSAIQQTLTPEAATVLTHSIAEAARRSHGQTTPLHVAATLLAAPNGLLRQACIRSHPNSSHPLQCRALELCFSVALERLPTTAGAAASPPAEPPLSNALVAALKRAQAHQRRGCPEQQQQPLLAVKVELEQLIISILDDPSVSRVMKEASFSSPAVKAAIEQAVSSQPSTSPGPRIGLGFRGPNVGGGGGGRSLYLNPRLQQQGGCNNVNLVPSGAQGREEDIKKVMDILGKPTKRNPILVGESEPQEVVKEVLKRVDKIRDGVLKDFTVMSMEKEFGLVDRSQMWVKVKELGNMIERKMLVSSCTNGIILDVGDLKWLVDQPVNPGVSELARQAVSEMGKILRKFSEGRRVWFIGTATCETYLRCQVYHPTMESEWDLQVVSVVAKAKPPVPGMLPRLGTSGGILSSSVECLTPMKSFPMAAPPLTRRVSENTDPLKKLGCCPHCTEKYNQELAKLTAEQAEKSSSEVKSDSTQKSLPFWLQNAKLNNNNNNDSSENNKDKDSILNRQKGELQKKWTDACLQLHPSFHRGVTSEKRIMASPLSITSLYNNNSPVLLGRQPSQSKPQKPKSLGEALQLNISPPFTQQPVSNHRPSPPSSPVRTDLMLGLTKPAEKAQEKDEHPPIKDLLGCISSESQNKKLQEKPTTVSDADSFKKLLKGLMDKVWWQKEAASALASTMTQCKSGNGKSRAGGSKGDIWLMFSGPDRIGKKKMAAALSELVCGMAPILISLGPRRDGDESDMNFRGKTALDRIVEAVRRNPFAVIMLQDIDEADMLIRGSIKRAMERGRLVDSHGREISLGNIIFILTSSWAPGQQKGSLGSGIMPNEEKLMSLASGGWQLRISIDERSPGKRPPSWLHDDHGHQGRATKQRKESGPGLSFDLNQRADIEDDRLDGSHNSSDLTMDHEEEHVHQNRAFLAASSAAHEFLGSIDEAIIFKPVDFTPIKQNIERIITARFSTILGDKFSLKIENEALERISSGVWLGQTSLESWAENVLLPSFHQMKTTLPSMGSPEGKLVARLELDNGSGSRNHGDWLPSRVSVVTNGS